MPDPTEADKAQADANMINTFGKIGNNMSKQKLAAMFHDVVNKGKRHDKDGRSLQGEQTPAYTLVGLPIVYHVLTQQHIRKTDPTLNAVRPSATAAQIAFTTQKTNALFNIYSRESRTSVQWASFVNSQTIYHDDLILLKDCNSLTDTEYANIIQDVSEWQYKLHAIICESTQWSGVTYLPTAFAPSAVKHNMVHLEYRALACYDEDHNFLATLLQVRMCLILAGGIPGLLF